MNKMYRVLFSILILSVFLVFSGCDFLSAVDEIEDSGEFFEDIEEVNLIKEDFYDSVLAEITEDAESGVFTMDYYMVTSADTIGMIYYSIVNLYLISPDLVDTDITKDGDTYTITDESNEIKVKYDKDTSSTKVEFFEDDVLTMVIESVKLSDNKYAYQLYTDEYEEDSATVIQFLLEGEDGSLSVNNSASAVPSSIYKASSVGSSFASAGTRVYEYIDGVYTFEGTTVDN